MSPTGRAADAAAGKMKKRPRNLDEDPSSTTTIEVSAESHDLQSASRKRQRNDLTITSLASNATITTTTTQAKPKLASIFAPPEPSNFRWLSPFDRTCLRGVHLSPLHPFTDSATSEGPVRVKIAAFDLDGTLIRFAGFGTKGPVRFDWWRAGVPAKLKSLHAEGYLIAIISNQKYKGKSLQRFQDKLPLIARALPDVPFYIFAATSDDKFRKPGIGMWDALVSMLEVDAVAVDKTQSFFVGDAAGRLSDHSDGDKGFAEAVGLSFHTPEAYFLGIKPK
ncbi:unnamed protein product [Peniophora sp. CBMAI 1063]|nr:unnamed protein product [Peniophora sp. CBMAI 1063]